MFTEHNLHWSYRPGTLRYILESHSPPRKGSNLELLPGKKEIEDQAGVTPALDKAFLNFFFFF